MSPKITRMAKRDYAPTTPRPEVLRSIAEQLAPRSGYLFGMLRHYAQDLSVTIWFEKSRPSRSHSVKFLKRCVGSHDPNSESELRTIFNRAPYATVHYSLTQMAGTSNPYEKARWLLRYWARNENAIQGRGKLCPHEMHPKVVVIAFVLALLEHLGDQTTTSPEVTTLAAELYRATAPHIRPWADTPYHSWRPHLTNAKKEIEGGKLTGQYRIDLTDILDQRDRDYCMAGLRSRWGVGGSEVCGAGGR